MNSSSLNCQICQQPQKAGRSSAEKRALAVVIVTLLTMAGEIGFGIFTGSMALLADGIHMGTHALALGITAVSYYLARRFATHNGFSFGTGKIGVLAGYTNALLLALSAFFMIYESAERLIKPQEIMFDAAILVTVIGLAINLLCALILGHDGHDHHHHHHTGHHEHKETNHEHEYKHEHDEHSAPDAHHHHDANMRGALLHVIADAMTSVLALAALFIGRQTGFTMLDPIVGMLGAALILKWAYGLLKETATLLLDYGDYRKELQEIKDYFSAHDEELQDLHIWRFGDNAYSLLVAVKSCRERDEIVADLAKIHHFDHLVVEKR